MNDPHLLKLKWSQLQIVIPCVTHRDTAIASEF